MIKFANTKHKKEKDSTVALINIVFLMLVFFLIAGTIVPPLDSEITPILAQETENADLENALSIRADGRTYYQGNPITPEGFISEILADPDNSGKPVRVLVDRELPATTLVETVNQLRTAGVSSVRLITERKE